MGFERVKDLIRNLSKNSNNLDSNQKELLEELIELISVVKSSDSEIEIRSLSYARNTCSACGRPFQE